MKIRRNPKIEVDSGELKQIGEVVCAEIKESLRKNGNVYRRAERSDRQYRQITSFDAAGKVCDTPWLGAADYFVPMTEWMVDAVHSRVMNVLFGIEGPYMTAEGTGPEDEGTNAQAITDFVDGVFRDIIKITDNIGYFFKRMLILPFAVLKYDWVNEFEPIISKDTAIAFINKEGEEHLVLPDDEDKITKAALLVANGYQPQPEPVDVWVRKDKETKDQAELKYIPIKDYVWDPNASKGTKPFWEGDRIWLTLNEMMNRANEDKFIKKSVEYVKAQQVKPADTSVHATITKRSKPRECFNWYGRLPFDSSNKINFHSDTALEQEVRIIVDYLSKTVLYIGYWEYERYPDPDRVYIRDFFEESDRFDGRSLTDKLYKTQYELNDFKNTVMNNAWISMQKIFVKKYATDSSLDDPEVYPGAIWEEVSTGDIRALEVGDVKAVGIEIENSLISYAERISNISLYQTGTAGKGQKTKGEVDATIYEGNLGLNRFVGRCHNVLKKICNWTAGYYYERMPEDLDRKIRGQTKTPAMPNKQEQATGQSKYWQPEDLQGYNKLNWIWNGTTLTSDKNRNIMISNDMMERYLPHPMVAGSLLAVWNILKDGLIARGKRDWEKYLPTEEAIVKEMELMQAKAEQAEKPGVEEVAIKKLMDERGLDQETATNLVMAQKGGGNVEKLVPKPAQGK